VMPPKRTVTPETRSKVAGTAAVSLMAALPAPR
jgi:hypothetical protein